MENKYESIGCKECGFILLFTLNAWGDNVEIPRIPELASDSWRICEMPDLGELAGPDARKQHVVDHGFFWLTIENGNCGRVFATLRLDGCFIDGKEIR